MCLEEPDANLPQPIILHRQIRARCPYLSVEPFDLSSPDQDESNTDSDIPNALPLCEYRGEEPCRYQIVFWPNPWSPFGPQVGCAAWEACYLPRLPRRSRRFVREPRVTVTTEAAYHWPDAPPCTAQTTEPTREATLALALQIVRHRVPTLADVTHRKAIRDLVEKLRDFHHNEWNSEGLGVRITTTADEIRISKHRATSGAEPLITMPLREFAELVIPAPASQLSILDLL